MKPPGSDRQRDAMQLNDLLTSEGIDPTQVLVLRHRPNEPQLRKIFPWLAATQPEVYNAFQQAHWPRAEAAMIRASHVLSCIGEKSKRLYSLVSMRLLDGGQCRLKSSGRYRPTSS
jgi:uroporphyrinogen-III synthase